MLKRISFTMAVVYGLIIIATISTLDFLIILTYRQEQLDKNQDRQIAFAEIIGNVVKDKLDDIMELNGTMRENSAKLDGRVLIVNKENKVLADNYAYYIGKQLDNDEVVRVIESKEQAIQYYHMDNQNIMIVATPILENKQLTGVVLISVSVDQIYQDVKDLEHQVIIISVIACIIAIFLSFIFGRKLSSPIEKLTAASEEILRGKLDTKVDIVRNDEIGKLAETFNKMSEEIYKTDLNRRRFIGDVSHELKTPLTSIKALIESLIEGNNEISTYKEYLIDVNGEIDRLSLMVSSLLIVTRLEEIELNMRPVDLYEEVDSIIKLFLPLADQYDIKLINKCQKNVAVLMDEARFKEILINLVDNSIKYSREGGFVEISCIKREEIVELIVRDNGCGISEGDLHCVFDIFYRVDESRTRKTGGSGIGLYLVKKIVELHGWSIKVKSRLNEGTEFIINIKSGL